MKKILMISPGYAPIMRGVHNGAIEQLMNIYFEHNDRMAKYDITVYSIPTDNELPSERQYNHVTIRSVASNDNNLLGISFHKLRRLANVLFGTSCARKYIKLVIDDLRNRNELNGYDAIIVENCVNDLLYIKKHLDTKTPIVLHLHNDYLYKGRKDAKKISSFLKEIWCVSNFLRDRVKNACGEDKKIHVIYNSVNADAFQRHISESRKNEIRKSLGMDKSDYVFIYVGRIMNIKGVIPAVRAFKQYQLSNANARLLLIGGRNKKHDNYYERFLRIIKNESHIKYIRHVDNDKLYMYYQAANCQLIPSKGNEAFGLVALEGKYSRLRVISTGKGGLREVLDKNDIIIDNLKKKTIVGAMQQAVSGKEAAENVDIDSFSCEAFCRNIDDRIEKIISSKGNVK